MKVAVDSGHRFAILGITEDAVLRVKGDAADLAVPTAALLVSPSLIGTMFEAAGATWRVTNWRAEGAICIYACKKVVDVPAAA